MTVVEKHKQRMNKLKELKSKSHIKSLATEVERAIHLSGKIDNSFIREHDLVHAYSQGINDIDLNVSKDEAIALLDSIGESVATNNILQPIFLSLFDGTMRAFKIGTTQGITPSRLYHECQSFQYDVPLKSQMLDSQTEFYNEQENINKFDQTSEFKQGKLRRSGQVVEIRDRSKMNKKKADHFSGEHTGEDEYGGEQIYANKKHAKSQGKDDQAAQTDHIVSCAEICNKLKANKGLTDNDIKDIVNSDENLAITSKQNNAGALTGKHDKSAKQLQKELDQGYVVKKKGKKIIKHQLTEEDKAARQKMINRMKQAQASMDKKTNKAVLNNLKSSREVQMRLSKDAALASTNQILGDLVIFLIKPLFFELSDCLSNGIEKGVRADSFKLALTYRFGRMKAYIIEKASALLKDVTFNFFKNFLSMLLEGIVNCFVGIFKNIARMVKEGFKIMLQIAPILTDKNKTLAQKGDAMLKLVIGSLSIFASIGIETWLNSLGLGEPWSIVISSVLTAVVTSLTMYLLDKLDLFNANKQLKARRIDEILNLQIKEDKEEIFSLMDALA